MLNSHCGQIVYHQVCRAQAGQIAFACDRDTAHAGRVRCLYACYCGRYTYYTVETLLLAVLPRWP